MTRIGTPGIAHPLKHLFTRSRIIEILDRTRTLISSGPKNGEQPSVNKGKKGIPIGYVKWGYYIDGAGNVSFFPTEPVASSGFPIELKHAVERWNKIPGYKTADLDYGK